MSDTRRTGRDEERVGRTQVPPLCPVWPLRAEVTEGGGREGPGRQAPQEETWNPEEPAAGTAGSTGKGGPQAPLGPALQAPPGENRPQPRCAKGHVVRDDRSALPAWQEALLSVTLKKLYSWTLNLDLLALSLLFCFF